MNLSLSPSAAIERCHCSPGEGEHDEVATRYCPATLSAALPRTCACALGPTTAARSYDRR
ncbi:RGCVC family protein [Sporichthya brevicatena]|uniref:RGCVC family protein n=1 Tax=Sporichthya brevicatena TaxID=171442 RepID=UPI0031CF6F5E